MLCSQGLSGSLNTSVLSAKEDSVKFVSNYGKFGLYQFKKGTKSIFDDNYQYLPE